MPEGVSRRDLLKKVGLGGVAFLGGSVLGHTVQHQANAAETGEEYDPVAMGHALPDEGAGSSPYGQLHSLPTSTGPGRAGGYGMVRRNLIMSDGEDLHHADSGCDDG